jgi:signal transduction histidine kinase/DNA-binding response OmpR family regulator
MTISDIPRILVVDDEQRMCDSLDTLLTKAGYEVETAGDGKKALELYRNADFDLVISDIKLPEMTGIELLQAIRKGDPNAMVILMTAYASLDTALAAINMGAYDYLMKPIEFTQLKLAAKRALEKRELEIARQKLMAELQIKNDLLNRRIAEVDALYQAGVVLSQSQELKPLLERIIRLALDVIGAQVGSVMLLDDNGAELLISASVGLSEEVRQKTRVRVGESIAGFVAQSGEALLIPDISSDPRFAKFSKGNYETKSLISVPLKIKDRVLGVLNLSDPDHGTVFEENDLRLLETFASQAAIAIDDAENLEKPSKKLNEFAVLYQLATEITTVDNSQDMTHLIYRSLSRIIDIDFALWLSWNERSETLVVNFWEGFGKKEAAALRSREVQLKDKTVYSAAVRTNAVKNLINEIPALRSAIKTFTSVPIITKGALHGLFCLGSRQEDAFSENDEYIASIVASQATSIYEKQRAVLSATRLMTMGKMMSEISHDLKKPLTNISGALQIMRDRWPEIAQSDDFFHTAQQEIHRLDDLLKELLNFSNPTKYQLEQKKTEDLIKRVIRLVENDLKKHKIEFTQHFEDELPGVLVNENEIVEVLLNLIINAIESMPSGGKLGIESFRELRSDNGRLYVVLKISDSGIGIAPEHLDRIFDRYFTTKESGTGLGLAICERIIMAHNGEIKVESVAGRGTAFIIKLPSA